MQSLVTFGGIFVLQIALTFTGFLFFLTPFVSLAGFILWIVLMIKAYQGEKFKLPVLGDIADQNKNAFGAEDNPPDSK